MSIINCFNCDVVNIPQQSSHKPCRTEALCITLHIYPQFLCDTRAKGRAAKYYFLCKYSK